MRKFSDDGFKNWQHQRKFQQENRDLERKQITGKVIDENPMNRIESTVENITKRPPGRRRTRLMRSSIQTSTTERTELVAVTPAHSERPSQDRTQKPSREEDLR